MLLSELMCQFLSSDLAYGIFVVGLGAVTLFANIIDDKRGR